MGKILALSEVYGKLSPDIGLFLKVIQYFWVSKGSSGDTSSLLILALTVSSQAHLGSRGI